jgi:hypothetical protein
VEEKRRRKVVSIVLLEQEESLMKYPFLYVNHVSGVLHIFAMSPFTARKGYTPPTKCPICIEGNIESMLINKNEVYKFDYDTKRGVVLEFLK